MNQIKRYLKSRKNPTPADRQLAKAYDNYIKPKTAKQLMDITFTPEYQAYVRKFWNDCHDEFVKAQAAKSAYESGSKESPEEIAKAERSYRKIFPEWKKEDLHPAYLNLDKEYNY
jgi:hypothetical protein